MPPGLPETRGTPAPFAPGVIPGSFLIALSHLKALLMFQGHTTLTWTDTRFVDALSDTERHTLIEGIRRCVAFSNGPPANGGPDFVDLVCATLSSVNLEVHYRPGYSDDHRQYLSRQMDSTSSSDRHRLRSHLDYYRSFSSPSIHRSTEAFTTIFQLYDYLGLGSPK